MKTINTSWPIKYNYFARAPTSPKTDYLEGIKSYLKVSKAHNRAIEYHPGLEAAALMDKHDINGNTEK